MKRKRSSETPLATQEDPRVSRPKSRRTPSSLLQLKWRSNSPPATREDPLVQSCNSRAPPPKSPVATREEPRDACQKSRGTPYFPLQLEKNLSSPPELEVKLDSPAASREETRVSPCNSRGGNSPVTTQEESQVPKLNSRGGLTTLLQLQKNP